MSGTLVIRCPADRVAVRAAAGRAADARARVGVRVDIEGVATVTSRGHVRAGVAVMGGIAVLIAVARAVVGAALMSCARHAHQQHQRGNAAARRKAVHPNCRARACATTRIPKEAFELLVCHRRSER